MKTKASTLAAGIFLATALAAFSQPNITIQPTNQSVSLGASAKFQVTATSTNPPILYQWRLATTNLLMATNPTLTLTNIQTTNAGDYDVVLTDGSGSITSQVAHLDVDATLTKIMTGIIVTNAGNGIACAWGDYDGDGFMDLIVTSTFNAQAGLRRKILLYHNNRDGTFTQVTNTVITAESRDWQGCSWVDYDNDGHLDLFVTSTDANGFSSQNVLFRNNGDGTFTKMTAAVVGAIVPGGGGSEGPIWADVNVDGFLDAFVVRAADDWLFLNNGDGTFAKVPNTNGIPLDNYATFRAMWWDYDVDGRPDLFRPIRLETGCAQSLLCRGFGNGLFTNVSLSSDCGNATSAAWVDYNNDGIPDLFVLRFGGVPNILYRGNGDGTFTRMTSDIVGSIASDVTPWAFDCVWGDYDNDGFPDLFIAQGADPGLNYKNLLYHNNGDGSFTRVLTGSLVNESSVYPISCALGDINNDGFLDLFITCGLDEASARNLLYRNNGNSNAWIKIKLVGMASNRSAIGAKVRLQATIGGKTMWQMREINSGNGFSGGPLEAHFGLGDATNIDTVRIEWPSGIVQTLTDVSPKQILTVLEHQQVFPSVPQFTNVSHSSDGTVNLSVTGDTNLLYVFEASTDLGNWTKVGVRSNATGVVSFTDTKATNYVSRFYRVSVP